MELRSELREQRKSDLSHIKTVKEVEEMGPHRAVCNKKICSYYTTICRRLRRSLSTIKVSIRWVYVGVRCLCSQETCNAGRSSKFRALMHMTDGLSHRKRKEKIKDFKNFFFMLSWHKK